jgi:putative restriction endonuclease
VGSAHRRRRDDITNGICLCALHHKLFDKGVLGMTGDRRVTVSAHYVGRGPAARDQVHALAGRRISAPQRAFPDVDDRHIAWHAREVFRSPARSGSRSRRPSSRSPRPTLAPP